MRFDLECVNIGTLSSEKLTELADIIYGDSSAIAPMLWDTKCAPDITNKGSINTDKFSNFNRDLDYLFTSGLNTGSTLGLNSIIKKDGTVTAIFNGGDFLAYRKKIGWSNNNIYGIVDYDEVDGYSYKLDDDYDPLSISVFTISTNNLKYFQIRKEYVYVEYDGTSLSTTFNKANKRIDYIYTIKDGKVYLNSELIEYSTSLGTYESGNAIFPLPEFPVKNITVNGFSASDYIIRSGSLLFNNYKENRIKPGTDVVVSFSVTPIIMFKNKSRNGNDAVFKNVNISPKALNFKSGVLGVYNCYDRNMLPAKLEFVGNIPESISFKDKIKVTAKLTGIDNIPMITSTANGSGVKLNIISDNAKWQETKSSEFTSDTALDGTISATISVDQSKIGMYIQKEWVENVTIDGKLKGQITLPFKLEMLGSSSRGYTVDDLKKVYLYSIYSNDPILGKISPIDTETPVIEYVTYKQDENTNWEEAQENTMKSYYINGRKVGYVKLLQSTNPDATLTSLFIKPIKIEKVNNKEFFFRDLYIKSERLAVKVRGTDGKTYSCKKWHVSNFNNKPVSGAQWEKYWDEDKTYMPVVTWQPDKNYFPSEQYVGLASSQVLNKELVSMDMIVDRGKYEAGILPYDMMYIYKGVAPEATVITYNDPFPIDPEINGYWMVTDRFIDIQAQYNDEYIEIKSDVISISMRSLESETAFTIAGFDVPNANTSIGEFGYLSMSDYLKSPFKLNSLSYYCIHSDCINKQCINKNKSYKKNFILDDGGIGCARTAAYEAANPEVGKCPGLDARLVNPFIL